MTPALVVCIVADHPPPAPSTASACDVCSVGVWLSYATRLDLGAAGVPYRPVCARCALGLIDPAEAPMAAGPRTIEAVRRIVREDRGRE